MNIWRTRPGISQTSFDFSIIIIARLTAVIECTDIRKSPRKVRSGLISVISGSMSIVGVEVKNTITFTAASQSSSRCFPTVEDSECMTARNSFFSR